MTNTQKRLLFLEKCLENGMTRGEAARELVKQDGRIKLSYARNLVYTHFSGRQHVINEPPSYDDIDIL